MCGLWLWVESVFDRTLLSYDLTLISSSEGNLVSTHPALQLRRELGLELTGGPLTVVPLNKHLVDQ